MWETIQISVGPQSFRGRFRVEAGRLVLEWAGGRASAWLGMLKPELVAAMLLKKLATRATPLAA